jgi:hypothetical protein
MYTACVDNGNMKIPWAHFSGQLEEGALYYTFAYSRILSLYVGHELINT